MFPQLTGVSGPAEALRVSLESDETTIGRHPTNSVSIRDGSVSRHHCLIRRREDGYYLSDLESSNGTSLNGELIATERLLANGDLISFGDATVCFVVADPNAPAKPSQVLELDQTLQQTSMAIGRQEALRISSTLFSPSKKSEDRTSKSLQALLGIGKLLASLQRVEQVQAQLFHLLSEVIPAEAGALLLVGYGSTEATLAYGWNRDGEPARELRISRTITDRVLKQETAVLSLGAREPDASASVVARQVTSVLCVPLIARDQTQGAIYLETTHPLRRFDEEHLKLLTAISGYSAIALDHSRRMEALERENARLRSYATIKHSMVGASPAMSRVYERIRKLSQSDATVLIIGESGTGKELVARALHMNSARGAEPFEAINCALLRETLLENELFGHEKGSFTGAAVQKKGKLEVADGGTVFLDEIGELTEGPQSMLLRVLQEREFTRVGGTKAIRVNIRLLAATNRDLENAVKEKEFREDLFYRLNVICLRLPALRERREDIPDLARHFLESSVQRNKRLVAGVAPKTIAALLEYSWPGNVRELENAIEHAVVFGSADEILPEDLPEHIVSGSHSKSTYVGAYHQAVRAARQQIVLDSLKAANYNYGAAAKALGIHVANLHRLIRELDLKRRLPRSFEAGT
ncbi:MAG: sigma 54-interacting transcriptional regulator [Bryobacteraceae bacterium]